MFSIILALACTEQTDPKANYKTDPLVEEIDDTGSSDTGNTSTDTGDVVEDGLHKVYFKTTNIPCSKLENFQVSLTQITPGGLEQEADNDNDVRNDLLAEIDLEYIRKRYSDFLDVQKDDFNSTNGCLFTITLPEDVPANLKDIIAVGEDPDSLGANAGKWAFYAITLITNEKISCEDPSSKLIGCSLVPQSPLSNIDYTKTNPELKDGDVYIWLSDIYLSYTTGVLSPSLQDMGFSNGWNLADISNGVMTVVESFDPQTDPKDLELMPISITLFDLVPTYSMSLAVENDWGNIACDTSSTQQCNKNQLGLRPLSWIVYGDDSDIAYSYKNLYYNGLGTSILTGNLELQVWGIPSDEYFFSGEDLSTESDEYVFFQQWGDFVDVSAHAPVVYEGTYNTTTATEQWASRSTYPKGAMCRGTERVVFVYYAAADELSEALWYRLTGVQPGWKVLYGTQDQIETWRFMVLATSGATDYRNIQISSGCSVPDWN